MTISIGVARAALDEQAFSRMLGAQMRIFQNDAAVLALTLDASLKQQHGFADDGVTSFLVDRSSTFAAAHRLGPRVVTSSIDVDCLHPESSSSALCACAVTVEEDGEEHLIAVGRARVSRSSSSSSGQDERTTLRPGGSWPDARSSR